MALIFEGKMPEPQTLNLDGYQPGWGRYLSAAFGQAWDFNPVPTINMNLDLLKAEGVSDDIFSMSEGELADYARDWRENPMPGVMSQAEQEAYIEDNGLKGQIRWDPYYTKEALDLIIENRKLENERKLITENGSAGQTAAGLGLGFIAGAFDPLNIASVLVPVAGEARLASMMLDSGENVFRRMGIRALQGASAGLSGSLMVEPLIAGGQTLAQSDYSMTQSLLNVMGGAVLGGAFHTGFGALGDLRRAGKGLPQPWEYVPPDDDSRALMNAKAGEIEESFREANPDGYTPEEIREMARAGAGLYDAAARRWAYKEKKTVGEFYELNDVAFQSWKDFIPEGWRDVLPEGWRKRGSGIGDALEDMSWIGREYEGLRELNADALELPNFMELMGEWERRFPDMEDFAGIRAGIEDLQKRGVGKQFEDALNQLAWHGSPHRFNKFSLKKIGTGEGAQVHGWGIYFAQSRETANGYRVRLGGSGYTYKGKPLYELYSELESRGDYDRLGVLEAFMTTHDLDKMDFSLYDSKAAEWFKKEIHPKLKGDGKLYEVDIPESAVLLDEQKTLAEQPKEVKEALAKAADAMPDDEAWADMSEHLYSALEENRATGRDLYNALAILGTKDYDQTLRISTKGARKASEFLNNFGVKGITYVGQEDGRCFVIFDDKAINVTNRLYHSEERAKAGGEGISGKDPAPQRSTEQIRANFEKSALIDVSGHEIFTKDNPFPEKIVDRGKAVAEYMEEHGLFGNFKNDDTGWEILVSKKSVRDDMSHGFGKVKAQLLGSIDKLLKNAVFTSEGRPLANGHKRWIFSAKARADNESYLVGIVIDEDVNRKRFYNHELTEIRELVFQERPPNGVSVTGTYQAPTVLEVIQNKLGVKWGSNQILFQTSPALRGRQTRILSTNKLYHSEEMAKAGHVPENENPRSAAQERLRADAEAWKKQLQRHKTNTLGNPLKEMTMLSHTPLVMQMVGAPDLPIKIGQGKLRKAMKSHNLSYNVTEKIPEALADPIMILKSQSKGGDLLMVLAIKDAENNGATVNVPIALNLKDSGGYEANIATTVFGRRSGKNGLPDNDWFVNQASIGNLLYRHRQKSRDWARSSKVQFLGTERSKSGRNKIYTDADLVKLQQENITLYQKPKQPGERGALPEEARARENEADLNDPDALLPPELQENPPEGPGDGRIYKGQVEFDPETGAAVITFFQAADLSTASHELFHVFRRQIERAANMADASPWAKEQWRKVCDFAGAREGQAWTAEMEEKFANAGLRYLASGAAPTPALQGVFERMKQWFMDIYQRADNIGVEISPQMRKAFNEMFTVPYDAADRDFRYAVADIHTREVERDFANPDSIGERLSPEDQAVLDAEKRGNLDALERFANDAEARANELTARLERDNPALAERLADAETRAEIENGRLEMERAERRDELRRDALECVANGG